MKRRRGSCRFLVPYRDGIPGASQSDSTPGRRKTILRRLPGGRPAAARTAANARPELPCSRGPRRRSVESRGRAMEQSLLRVRRKPPRLRARLRSRAPRAPWHRNSGAERRERPRAEICLVTRRSVRARRTVTRRTQPGFPRSARPRPHSSPRAPGLFGFPRLLGSKFPRRPPHPASVCAPACNDTTSAPTVFAAPSAVR